MKRGQSALLERERESMRVKVEKERVYHCDNTRESDRECLTDKKTWTCFVHFQETWNQSDPLRPLSLTTTFRLSSSSSLSS